MWGHGTWEGIGGAAEFVYSPWYDVATEAQVSFVRADQPVTHVFVEPEKLDVRADQPVTHVFVEPEKLDVRAESVSVRVSGVDDELYVFEEPL